jgi:predicted metal-binding protein
MEHMQIGELLKTKLHEFDENIHTAFISPKDIDFEEKVGLLCFQCKNYKNKFTCPPHIPKLDYNKIIGSEYKNAMLVYTRMSFSEISYPEVRTVSTIKIHRALLYLEKILFDNTIVLHFSLIGGSCKLCKSGCPKDKCNNPSQARIPMEAIGINVVSTAKKAGIDIKFPVKDSLYRCGLILWS